MRVSLKRLTSSHILDRVGNIEPESHHVVFSCNRPGGIYSCISECCSREIYTITKNFCFQVFILLHKTSHYDTGGAQPRVPCTFIHMPSEKQRKIRKIEENGTWNSRRKLQPLQSGGKRPATLNYESGETICAYSIELVL